MTPEEIERDMANMAVEEEEYEEMEEDSSPGEHREPPPNPHLTPTPPPPNPAGQPPLGAVRPVPEEHPTPTPGQTPAQPRKPQHPGLAKLIASAVASAVNSVLQQQVSAPDAIANVSVGETVVTPASLQETPLLQESVSVITHSRARKCNP